MAESLAGEPAARESRQAWLALWSLLFGFFMMLVDSTIVSIATPTLMQAFEADVGEVVWVTSAYLLAYAVPLLITGRLGDRFGPKTIYLVGLTIFTLASVACGLAWSIEALIVARVVQGFGAALLTPQTMAIITRLFPPQRRGAAMGVWGATAGVATLAGPLLGGVLIDGLGWEWIFFVNAPVGVVGFIMVVRNVPALEKHAHGFDWLGVVLSAVGLFCIVFGIEEGQTYAWGHIWGPFSVWGLIITGVVVMIAFVVWQAAQKGEPLLPLQLFGDRNFAMANVSAAAMGAMITAMVFPLLLYVQNVRGLAPTQAALLTVPMALISGGLAPVVGRLIDKRDPRPIAVAGFVLLAAALVLHSALMRPGVPVLWLLVPYGLVGLAMGGIWGPLSVSATRNLPPHWAGAGSGVYNSTRQLGAVLGSASIAAVMQSRLAVNLTGASAGAGDGHGAGVGRVPAVIAAPFTKAMSESMWFPVAAAVVGLVGALLMAPHRVAADGVGAPAGQSVAGRG
ncbi:DHA2 family efflux MFS transporter permease subunit [Propionibacteriaceae bacterium G1746]